MFKGRKLIIATKHHKEKVIQPLLEKSLGVKCFVPNDFDTDLLGTFSGEVERKDDPITTLRKKCFLAMTQYHCDLGVASEGSFGAHPSIFFASADDEFLIFIDKKNDLEIIARNLSTTTNFNAKEVFSESELLKFAEEAQFPSHALILKENKNSTKNIVKGINSKSQLVEAFNKIFITQRSVYVETDMRAMHNPTRMKVIEEATHQLINKIKTKCPNCKTPGFFIQNTKPGLPCQLCGNPTRATLSQVYQCKKCDFVEEILYPNGITTEDPTYCDFCNP